MYGLPQSGILIQELLEERLDKHGYKQSNYTPGLRTHEWRPIIFSLVVDNFGVKYVGWEHAEHLISVVKEHYDLTVDEKGTRYLGLTLDWDYPGRKVHLSMPDYIPDALKRFKHERPGKRQLSPHKHVPPTMAHVSSLQRRGTLEGTRRRKKRRMCSKCWALFSTTPAPSTAQCSSP